MGAAARGAAAPLLRPRSAPQLFDAIIQVARAHAWDLFALSLIFHAPVHLFRILGAFLDTGSPVQAWLPEPNIGVLWWLTWNSLAVSACAVATCQLYRDGSTSIAGALAAMRAGGWRFFGTVAAFEVLVDGPWLLSSDSWPAFWWAIVFFAVLPWLAPTIPAGAAEGVTPWNAVRRSLLLVRHNYWRVALCVWIVWGVTWFSDNELVGLVGSLVGKPAVPRITDFVVDGAVYALRGITIAVLYFDCRVRREGYDVEHLMETVPT